MRDVDLNLLSIFDTIMTEGSVTKAAQQLAMTQSAVSNAVARMRLVWKDPLFIKEGRGIRPTPKASAIWRDIGLPLATIRETVNPAPFDPATTARRFRLATTDFITYPCGRRYAICWTPGARRRYPGGAAQGDGDPRTTGG